MLIGLWVGHLKTWQNTDSYIVKLFTACYEIKVHALFLHRKIKLHRVYFVYRALIRNNYMKIYTL